MKQKSSPLQIIWGLVLLGSIVYGIYTLFRLFLEAIPAASSNLVVALIGGFITLLASILTIGGGYWVQTQSLIKKDHRDKKAPIYEEYVAYMTKMFLSQLTEEESGAEGLRRFFTDFNGKLTIWGGDLVIQEWTKFRELTLQSESDSRAVAIAYERMIRAIRKDLGHNNKGLEANGVLLSMFMNDAFTFFRDSDEPVNSQELKEKHAN